MDEKRAYKLINTPEKWSNQAREISNGRKHCALTAIVDAYGMGIERDFMANKLRKILKIVSIANWNDGSDWETVYQTLKEHDI